MRNIQIIELDFGNVGSVERAFKRAYGLDSELIKRPCEVKNNSLVVIPGVGNFDHAMDKLDENEWVAFIKSLEGADEVSFFGICLGMQLFFDGSEEGSSSGLGILKGTLRSFGGLRRQSIRPTHIGWNAVSDFSNNGAIGPYYFVHSYFAPVDPQYTRYSATYGVEFSAAIEYKNFVGTQFHPEKSGRKGVKYLRDQLKC